MKHARADYDRIQDPTGLIGEDEPVFLLRGKDVVAAKAVRAWAALAEVAGTNPIMVNAALAQADRMEFWQGKNVCKVPDIPADALTYCLPKGEGGAYHVGQTVGYRGTKRAPDPNGGGASIIEINGMVLTVKHSGHYWSDVDLEDIHE